MQDFFKLVSVAEFTDKIRKFAPLDQELIPLPQALGRILAQDIVSPEDLPPFSRSTVDGFGVRAADTFGCSDSETALLRIVGEIDMGAPAPGPIRPGETMRLWTGGILPPKADAAVMLEYTQTLDAETVGIFRPVAPGENCIRAAEDVAAGQHVLSAGHPLSPQDLGLLAGLGVAEVMVYRRPQVAIVATGDELVPYTRKPKPGQIRDINALLLASLVSQAGGEARLSEICPDDFDHLFTVCQAELAQADVLLLSGGTSVGQRDLTRTVFEALEKTKILAHGVSIRPGKPTILARQNNKALFGLPGHVASAMVTFLLFVRPLLRQITGQTATPGLRKVRAQTEQKIPSVVGREDYVCVQLVPRGPTELPLARPVFGKSGLLSPLVRAQGLLSIGRDVEGLDRGVEAPVLLFPEL